MTPGYEAEMVLGWDRVPSTGSQGAIRRTADLRHPRPWIEEKAWRPASMGQKILPWVKEHAGRASKNELTDRMVREAVLAGKQHTPSKATTLHKASQPDMDNHQPKPNGELATQD